MVEWSWVRTDRAYEYRKVTVVVTPKKKIAIKEGKKDTVAEEKWLILNYKLTKGDIRGKAMKQLHI